MDPFTHTFTGGLMAAGGLRKLTPYATAAILLGVNAPDIDIVASWLGEYHSLAYRRGWTHGVLAWLLLPLLISTGVMLVAKWCRVTPAFWPLFLVSMLAVLSHPLLDWLNNYGIRLLMPFDNQWFYGDTLFVVDPWMWLILGGAWFWMTSSARWQQGLWALFWLASSAVVSLNSFSTSMTLGLWYTGLAGILAVRLWRPALPSPGTMRIALGLAVTYIVINGLASRMAVEQVHEFVQRRDGAAPLDIMVAPVPANPLQSSIVVAHGARYELGRWDWTAATPISMELSVAANHRDPVYQAAAASPGARLFLRWSRYPYAIITRRAQGGYRVSFKDARYSRHDNALRGPIVELNAQLAVEKEYSGDEE